MQIQPRIAVEQRAVEQPSEVGKGMRRRGTAEQDPAEQDHKQAEAMAQDSRDAALFQPEQLFDAKQHTEIQAPEQEIPVRTVPEARQRPDDQQIPHQPHAVDTAAAQREVDIIPEPLTQRNMPAPPKIRDRTGQIGIVEVFRKGKAHHPAEAKRHIRIAGEVKIDLQRIGKQGQPRRHNGNIADLRLPDGIDHRPQCICQQELFAQADRKAEAAVRNVRHPQAAGLELRLQRAIAHKRPLQHTRKHA